MEIGSAVFILLFFQANIQIEFAFIILTHFGNTGLFDISMLFDVSFFINKNERLIILTNSHSIIAAYRMLQFMLRTLVDKSVAFEPI